MNIEINAVHDSKVKDKLKITNQQLQKKVKDLNIEILNKELSKVIKNQLQNFQNDSNLTLVQYLENASKLIVKTQVYDKIFMKGQYNNWILQFRQQIFWKFYQGRKGLNFDLQFFHLFRNLTKTRIGINYQPQVKNDKLKIQEFKILQSFSFPFITFDNSYYFSIFAMQKFALLSHGLDFRNEYKGIQITKNQHSLALYQKADEIGNILRYYTQYKGLTLDLKTKIQDYELKHKNIIVKMIYNKPININPKKLLHFKNQFLLSYCDYKSSYDNTYSLSCYKDKDKSRFNLQSLQSIGSRIQIGELWFHTDFFNQLEFIKNVNSEQIINDTLGLMFHAHGFGFETKFMFNFINLKKNNIFSINFGWL